MSQIKLINSGTGIPGAFPLASVEWSALSALTTPFSATMVNVSDVTDTHKTFYYIDNVDVSSITILDTIKPTDTRSLFRLGTETAFRANFLAESAAVPWSSFDTPATWQVPVQNANALEGHGTFTPNRLYYSNETASVDYRTAAGGEVGGALGMYPASGNMYALMCVGAKQTSYLGGFYQQSTAGFCPRWNGTSCIDFSTHPTRNFSTASVAEVLGAQDVNPIPAPVGLVAQCVYTAISGYPYIAMCAIAVDSTGKAQRLSGVFIPGWFWGEYQTPASVDPAQISQYWGFDAEPNRESGSYSYTAEAVDFPTAVQPYSGIASDGHGLHVYKMTGTEYAEVLATLWGDGTFSQAIWRKFQNYKSNPIAAICACHKLPGSLMPALSTQVQIRAAGCALTAAAGAYYANSKTTVDETARTLNVGKFFTSFLNWEPYTSCDLFLPFVGWTKIPADRVMGGSLTIKYRCDIITGNVSVLVRCFSGANGTGTNTATYQHTGNAALSVPISGNDNGTGKMLGAIAAGIGVAAAGIASGGSAALAAAGAGAGLGAATAKNTLQTASDYSGNAASIGVLTPFLIITMPIEYTSKEFRDLHGTASGIGVTVGQLEGTGYTEFSQYQCDFECTEAEAREIEDIMKSGVIL